MHRPNEIDPLVLRKLQHTKPSKPQGQVIHDNMRKPKSAKNIPRSGSGVCLNNKSPLGGIWWTSPHFWWVWCRAVIEKATRERKHGQAETATYCVINTRSIYYGSGIDYTMQFVVNMKHELTVSWVQPEVIHFDSTIECIFPAKQRCLLTSSQEQADSIPQKQQIRMQLSYIFICPIHIIIQYVIVLALRHVLAFHWGKSTVSV